MTPFYIKDCVLSVLSTGLSASSLAELREIIETIHSGSIYYHFWGERLRPGFVHSEYINAFSSWAHFSLHDDILAERLAILDPSEYHDTEALRAAVLEIIEKRVDEIDFHLLLRKEHRFYFLRSILTVFDSPYIIKNPSDWKMIMPTLSDGSIYYHFIDSRRRTHLKDDFSLWFESFEGEYAEVVEKIRHIDPYPLSLREIKNRLVKIINEAIA